MSDAPHADDWSRLFLALPIGAYRSTPEGRLLRANPALVRMNGYRSEAEIVAAVQDAAREWYVQPGRRAELLARLDSVDAVSGFISEVRQHATGQPMWVSESVTVVRDAEGRPVHFEGTVEDVTEAVTTRRTLERRDAQLRLLGEQLPAMMYRVHVARDGTQTFEYVSEGVQQVFGVTVDEVLADGTVLGRLAHPDDTAVVHAERDAALQGRSARSAVFRVRRPDGQVNWVHLQSAVVEHGEHGDMRTGVVLDITDHHEAERLRRERDDAEARRRATASLMSRVSHELRTPLNAVLGFGQLLVHDPNLGERQREWSRLLLDSGRHLLALVEDVLDLTRADGGELMLRPTAVALRDVVQSSWSMQAPDAAAAGVSLAPLPDRLPLVLADSLRLRQVIGNLLSNAIKYNRRGGEVRLTLDHEGAEVAITVADTGIGLSADQVSRLFQPFERIGAEQSRVTGTGLGLALSRELVSAMGGRIVVESEPGQGSRFTVWLRAADADGPAGMAA